jgi:hypothetical protein
METIDQPARRIDDAERPLWIGQTPGSMSSEKRWMSPQPLERLVPPLKTTPAE